MNSLLSTSSFRATHNRPQAYVCFAAVLLLKTFSWFRNTSRTQSEDVLEIDGREGSYLVRPSSQKQMYTLSVFTRSAG